MRTVFIADDEDNIREGLKCIMDWEGAGFSVCGEAANGEDTLNGILRQNPSLCLLDIKMPKLNGIDVIKHARESGYRGKFIILSGYSDFTYAQSAMRYGVDFYLTKPIDEDELSSAIDRIRETLDKEEFNSQNMIHFRQKAKDVILHELVTGIGVAEGFQFSKTEMQDLHLTSNIYQVVIYENFLRKINGPTYSFADLLKVANKENHTFEHFEKNQRDVILLKGDYALSRFQDFLSHYEKEPPQQGSPLDSLFLAYGRPVTSLEQISSSYKEALALVERRFFCIQGQHTLGFDELPDVEAKAQTLSDTSLENFSMELSNYLQSFNRKKVAETLYELEQYLYNVKNNITEVKLFLTDLYLQIKERMNYTYSTANIPFPSNSSIIEFIEKKYYLYEIILFFSEQFEMIMNSTGNPSRDSVLDDILYYIDHNYKTNIKLETIAPLFGYNSAYLGKIFTKTTGESFNSYVDHMRIEHSKELLMENRLKVYEIAEQVGYKNVDYFHKKFKKYVGMSPAEYRKTLDL